MKEEEYNGLVGKKINKLTIQEYLGLKFTPNGSRKYMGVVLCDCGKSPPFITDLRHVLAGKCRSCGCLKAEKTREANKKYNKYDLTTHEYGVGYTTKGETFIFDKEDYDLIKDYAWYMDKNGYVFGQALQDSRKTIEFHRLVMNVLDEDPFIIQVDHKFHIPSDNRKEMLRVVTVSQNAINKRTGTRNKTQIVGVYYDRARNKWVARMGLNGKNVLQKRYDTFNDAARARLKAEVDFVFDYAPQLDLLVEFYSDDELHEILTEDQYNYVKSLPVRENFKRIDEVGA